MEDVAILLLTSVVGELDSINIQSSKPEGHVDLISAYIIGIFGLHMNISEKKSKSN